METLVGIEGSEEGNIGDCEACKPTSDLASLKQDADPVVYKLVRVDFDGRFVPATDDELMEVEQFFDYGNNELISVADIVETARCSFGEEASSVKPLLGRDEGFSQFEQPKVGEEQLHARIERADEMLERFSVEERHRSACGSPAPLCAGVTIGEPDVGQYKNFSVVDDKVTHESPSRENLSISASISHDVGSKQSVYTGDCPDMQGGVLEDGTSGSAVCSSLKPDFSLLTGEMDMERLTIRELQETFRATFGRETSVKDKQWLKRRIAMGLANSCDIPLTNFIIKDNKVVKKVEDMNSEKADGPLVREVGVLSESVKDTQADNGNETRDASNATLGQATEVDSKGTISVDIDQRAAKRPRKPTKRYIEELSDMGTQETVGRSSLNKHSGATKALFNSDPRPAWGIRSSAVVMRSDSLGGSGVQVPFVSRVRRCRPRKSIIAFSPFRLEAQMFRDATGDDGVKVENISRQKVSQPRAVPFAELPSDEEKSEQQCSQIDATEMAQDPDPTSADSSGNNSNFDFTSKGGMRRKHHRAWSLSEVVKLVDGVSRYGAGRWSEIKRISFASYSYRTSVDLKDKWRNLLKAAAMSFDKGMNQQRKPTSMPIPTPILLKVRELAEMNNNQTPRNLKAGSGNGGQM